MKFTNFNKFLLCLPALGLACLAEPSMVSAAPTITNAARCDFDGDNVPDQMSFRRQKLTVTLSKNNKKASVQFDKTYRILTCRDTNRDGKKEVFVKVRAGAQPKVFFVGGNNGLLQVCNSVKELSSCQIWKSKQSNHITDQRQQSTGFITLRGCPGSFPNPLTGYDSNGQAIHKMSEYFPSGSSYDSRHYGCFASGDCKNPGALAAEAKRKTGKEDIYLRDSSGACVRVPDPGQCYNSSGC